MAIDKNGTELKVGDPVKISAHVVSIDSDTAVTVESDEINYPTSITAKKSLAVNSRIVVKD